MRKRFAMNLGKSFWPSQRLVRGLAFAATGWTAAWLAGCASGAGTIPPAEVPGAVVAKASVYQLNPDNTRASFSVAVVDLINVSGEFRQASGRLTLGPKGQPQRVEVELKAASADAGSDWLNELLLGPKFYNASQHPLVTFRAEQFAVEGTKLTEVGGDLTLRGITKPITLKVNRFDCREAAAEAVDRRSRCEADATAQIKRTDFDMKSWLDSVNEFIRIDIRFTAFAEQ